MTIKAGWEGRFYENFEVGDIYQHRLGRTISDADNTWFTLLTMNTHEVHFNVEAAKASEFGKVLVGSSLTLSIARGQSVVDTSQNAMANLALDEVRFTRPVFNGDTLWSESMVIAKRESRSRPQAGIVTIKTRTLNQDGEEVLSFLRTFYMYRRGAKPGDSSFPDPKESFTASDVESLQ